MRFGGGDEASGLYSQHRHGGPAALLEGLHASALEAPSPHGPQDDATLQTHERGRHPGTPHSQQHR